MKITFKSLPLCRENVRETVSKENVAELIDSLPLEEKTVLALYYAEELTVREIGAVLDIPESLVCQIGNQALGRLRTDVGQYG